MISITIHEFAHAVCAVACGDDTPRRQGRISLNPLDHFDPVGFTMVLLTTLFGFGIGWGKPVQINPSKFRHPRWDEIKVSAWGPLSNIILAVLSGIIVRQFGQTMPANMYDFVITMVFINITLALFNLIPLPPLDGSHILAGLLPYDMARSYSRFAAQYGMAVLLVCLFVPIDGRTLVGFVLGTPTYVLAHLIAGV